MRADADVVMSHIDSAGLICLAQVPRHRVPMDAQGGGNPAHGPVAPMQRKDGVDLGHFELIRHVAPRVDGTAKEAR